MNEYESKVLNISRLWRLPPGFERNTLNERNYEVTDFRSIVRIFLPDYHVDTRRNAFSKGQAEMWVVGVGSSELTGKILINHHDGLKAESEMLLSVGEARYFQEVWRDRPQVSKDCTTHMINGHPVVCERYSLELTVLRAHFDNLALAKQYSLPMEENWLRGAVEIEPHKMREYDDRVLASGEIPSTPEAWKELIAGSVRETAGVR